MILGETAGKSNPSLKAQEQTCQTEWWSSVLLATRMILQMDEIGAESWPVRDRGVSLGARNVAVTLLLAHRRCRRLLFLLITHTETRKILVGLPWTKDRPC